MSTVESRAVQDPEELRRAAGDIAARVNADPTLGVLFLVDPARVLEEVGFQTIGELRQQVGRSMLGITRSQKDAFGPIRQRARRGEAVSGIRSVRLRPRPGGESRRDDQLAQAMTAPPIEGGSNPLGGYDMVINLAEHAVERIAGLAYDDGVIPHRIPMPAGAELIAEEIVIGRPKAISFDTTVENGVLVQLPFALMKGGNATTAEATAVATVQTIEQAGQPAYLGITLADITNLTFAGQPLDQGKRDVIALVLRNWLASQSGLPLSPLLQMVSSTSAAHKFGLVVDDFDLKVCNAAAPSEMDSVAVCINLEPNGGAGNLASVLPFVEQEWGIGVNERVLRQVFDAWWASTEANAYRRLSKSALENAETLHKQGKLGEIFDPNGSIVITGIEFSLKQGYIDVKGFVTAENEFLWIDADCELTARAALSINPKTHKLEVTVTDTDFSVSCWSKFLMGLLGAFFGVIGGAIVGGLIGAVAGGIVGGVVGATVGVGVGAGIGLSVGALMGGVMAGAVLPALGEAIVQGKLGQVAPFDVIEVEFAWQLPDSDLVLEAAGQQVTILSGEVLVGGTLDMPALAAAGVELALKKVESTPADIVLPWAAEGTGKGLGSGGSYLVTTSAHLVIQATAMEKPFSCTWTIEGQPVAGNGDEAVIAIVPTIGQRFKRVDVGNGLARLVPEAFLQITRAMWVVGKDGKKGAPTIVTAAVSPPVFSHVDVCSVAVNVADAVGVQAAGTVPVSTRVLGDHWADLLEAWWAEMKWSLVPRLSPEDLPRPSPPPAALWTKDPPIVVGKNAIGVGALPHRRPELIGRLVDARTMVG